MISKLNRKLQEGDAQSFSRLFKETHPRMMVYCRLFVKNEKDAQDLVQECFMRLWRDRKKIDPNKSVESLLFVSLRNRCLNYLKDQGRYAFSTMEDGVLPNEVQYLYQLDFTEKRELSLEEQLIVALKKAIEELPERKREVLKKNKIEGLKQKQIAEELGISIKTVEKHIQEAKQELRIKLEKEFMSFAFIIYLMLH